ncbi:hypothetical protein XF35_16720 [Streptomyces platensis subsp. clarensis]|nr:hypothetical protein [Streptomyces platensis subsp. clarensis]
MDDSQLARVRRHTAGWKHQAGYLIGVFTMHRDTVLSFLADVMTVEGNASQFGIITSSKTRSR